MNTYLWLSNLFRDRRGALRNSLQKLRPKFRLQNSPYFCVFKYARAVKQKVWNEAETRERDWGETLHARKTLTPRFPDFFTDLEKKSTILKSNRNLIRWNRCSYVWREALVSGMVFARRKSYPAWCDYSLSQSEVSAGLIFEDRSLYIPSVIP